MATVTLPALRNGPVAWFRTISSLWTASQVKSSSFWAVKACRSQTTHKEMHKGSKKMNYLVRYIHNNSIQLKISTKLKPQTGRAQVQLARHTVPAWLTGFTLSSMCDSNVCPRITGHRLSSSLWAEVTLRTRSPCNSINRGGCDGSLYTVISAGEI